MKTEVLSYRDIGISYKDKNVLSGFNLEINMRENILLKGMSGSRKSTLLKLTLGFAHQISGSIYFENRLLDSNNIWEARKFPLQSN
ncbi:MAG: ATP-binding cassette domain-containing protein [Methanosarcinaceae archaeon]|nr:ATP-binding cassette domain-containing protein [Methanosarcinaceae archaeon]